MVPKVAAATKVVAEARRNQRDEARPQFTDVTHPPSLKVSIKALVELPEWRGVYTESAIRGLIDKARVRRSSRGLLQGNGLLQSGALIKLGRRILIDTEKFRAWVESHRLTDPS